MKTEHTAGPWKCHISEYKNHEITNESGQMGIAQVYLFDADEQTKANAKLIEAAPILLEALIELIRSMNLKDVIPHYKFKGLDLGGHYVGSCSLPDNKSIHMAVNAIKKATE